MNIRETSYQRTYKSVQACLNFASIFVNMQGLTAQAIERVLKSSIRSKGLCKARVKALGRELPEGFVYETFFDTVAYERADKAWVHVCPLYSEDYPASRIEIHDPANGLHAQIEYWMDGEYTVSIL